MNDPKIIEVLDSAIQEANVEGWDYVDLLFEDAQEILEALRLNVPSVIELSEISPNIYVWLEDRDDGTIFPLKGGVIDPDGDDYFRFDADFGEDFVYYPTEPFGKHWRVWDKCPTPEQMRDTPWEVEDARSSENNTPS